MAGSMVACQLLGVGLHCPRLLLGTSCTRACSCSPPACTRTLYVSSYGTSNYAEPWEPSCTRLFRAVSVFANACAVVGLGGRAALCVSSPSSARLLMMCRAFKPRPAQQSWGSAFVAQVRASTVSSATPCAAHVRHAAAAALAIGMPRQCCLTECAGRNPMHIAPHGTLQRSRLVVHASREDDLAQLASVKGSVGDALKEKEASLRSGSASSDAPAGEEQCACCRCMLTWLARRGSRTQPAAQQRQATGREGRCCRRQRRRRRGFCRPAGTHQRRFPLVPGGGG